MRIVVTGAAGFVGANLARAWVAAGHKVVAVVHPSSDTWRLRELDLVTALLDLGTTAAVGPLLDRTGPDVIVNAAAHGAYAYQSDIDRMVAVNLRAVDALVRWATERHVPLLHL